MVGSVGIPVREDRQAAIPAQGWLPAVLPATAVRFRVADRALAGTLAAAGAELVDRRPDVELGPAAGLRGDAGCAIVAFDALFETGGPLPVRVARRLLGSVAVRVRARRARRRLRRLGYREARVLLWDENAPIGLPGGARPPRRGLRARLPLGALAIGHGHPPGATMLDAAVANARTRLELAPNVRQGVLVAMGSEHVLRMAVGPARGQLAAARAGLAALRATDPPEAVRRLVPWPLGEGRAGLADWTLERRLPGAMPGPALSDELLADARDFLLALHGCAPGSPNQESPAGCADTIAAFLGAEEAATVRELAARVESEVADLPRGFGHGDFCAENLLAADGHLVGVIDWDASGSGRLPLVDLLHLVVTSERARHRRRSLGVALCELVLPRLDAGGGELVASYCRRTGVPTRPDTLRALAAAYWLRYAAYQLGLYLDRGQRTQWMDDNVRLVLSALGGRVGVPGR
jgi:hypothetical protein